MPTCGWVWVRVGDTLKVWTVDRGKLKDHGLKVGHWISFVTFGVIFDVFQVLRRIFS